MSSQKETTQNHGKVKALQELPRLTNLLHECKERIGGGGQIRFLNLVLQGRQLETIETGPVLATPAELLDAISRGELNQHVAFSVDPQPEQELAKRQHFKSYPEDFEHEGLVWLIVGPDYAQPERAPPGWWRKDEAVWGALFAGGYIPATLAPVTTPDTLAKKPSPRAGGAPDTEASGGRARPSKKPEGKPANMPAGLFEAALWWHHQGVNVLPLKKGEKHPGVKWKELQQRRVTEAELGRWRPLFKHGVCFITGAVSDRVVIETDGPAGDAILAEFEKLHGQLPDTLIIQSGSGRGVHLHFRHPGRKVKTIANPEIKLDIKGDGGIAVLPPSLHKSGGRYAIISESMEVAELPEGLLEFIEAKAREAKGKGEPESGECKHDPNDTGARTYSLRAELELHSALQHVRTNSYDSWFRKALAFRRLNWEDALAFELFHEVAERSKGYVSEADCRAKWDNVGEGQSHSSKITIATVFHEAKQNGWTGWVPTQEDYEALASVDEADEIDKLNAEFAIIENPVCIYRVKGQQILRQQDAKLLLEDRYIQIGNGDKVERKKLYFVWLSSSRRRKHREIVFRPGQPSVTKNNELNLFNGFPVHPIPGDVGPFLELVRHVANYNDEHTSYLLCWFAHLFQHPETKMMTAPFIVSKMTGVGKSLLIERIGSLLGEYFKPVSSREIKGNFNSYLEKCLLICVDEAMLAGRVDIAEKLKDEITRRRSRLNIKWVNEITIDVYANWVFTSNRLDGLFIEDKDRRYFAIRSAERRLPQDFYTGFCQWWDDKGKNNVMDFLCAYSLESFDPHAPAPETEFKAMLIADNRTDAQRFIAGLVAEDDGRPLRQLETLISTFCDADERDRRKKEAMLVRALHDIGSEGRQIRATRTPERKVSLWPKHDCEAWKKRTDREWAEQFLSQPDGEAWLEARKRAEAAKATHARRRRDSQDTGCPSAYPAGVSQQNS